MSLHPCSTCCSPRLSPSFCHRFVFVFVPAKCLNCSRDLIMPHFHLVFGLSLFIHGRCKQNSTNLGTACGLYLPCIYTHTFISPIQYHLLSKLVCPNPYDSLFVSRPDFVPLHYVSHTIIVTDLVLGVFSYLYYLRCIGSGVQAPHWPGLCDLHQLHFKLLRRQERFPNCWQPASHHHILCRHWRGVLPVIGAYLSFTVFSSGRPLVWPGATGHDCCCQYTTSIYPRTSFERTNCAAVNIRKCRRHQF
jgi:hypothetical protein